MITLPSGQTLTSRKLNVGCGFAKMEGYVNVDLQAFHEPDIVGDARDLRDLPSCAFEEIQARDVIEHFRWSETPRALIEWNRLLQLGGRLFLTTTHLPGLLRRMDDPSFANLANQQLLIVNLFSMQAYEGDYHLTAFTERLMRHHLWRAGFEVSEIGLADGWLLNVWAVKVQDHAHQALVDADISHGEFVSRAYRMFHLREADAAGLAGWTALLESGEKTRRDVVREFLTSQEREDRLAPLSPNFTLTIDRY